MKTKNQNNNRQILKLGEVCSQPQYGYTTKATDVGSVRLLRTTDITSGSIDWETVPFCAENPKEVEKYLLYDGDIVISRAGSVGVSFLIENPKKAVFASYLIRFKPNESIISRKYFYYFLKSPFYWSEISEKSLGIAVPNVNATKLAQIPIPLPPLPTQHAIVAKIESLFANLDQSVAQLKTAQAQLKTYRQAVLNEELGNEEWEVVKIEDVARIVSGYAFKSNDFKSNGIFQVIRIGNVKTGNMRLGDNAVFLDKVTDSILEKTLLKKDDIVITLTGTRTKRDYGYTALVNTENLLLNQRLAFFRFNKNYLPKYFLYYSWTDSFKNDFFEYETGNVGQGNVGVKAITKTEIPLPPLPEQRRIVNRIETRLQAADAIEKKIAESLAQAELLRQSILKEAFEGRLV